ncbi:hypothetical protein, conserved [Babesia bigemina]|uniref:C3H1-type domain-containing protein n=1 Tax=Babesia bigemina TaxID=5866 RepID=A0A061BIS4_BABBI|nr:hypothetical protein, conserved [Babesia bigemina]CDR71384.1 hypothetical protein, conserved [Babesia bigemina]|eukprot:XP_012770334.1 hypothetical protein, conserved [Babesia bigemina]
MGFLSGVLSNIHKHLGQHKGEINNAITSLETNKHAGKKGFSVAIVKVVEGVGGYNDKVRESNERIRKTIETLTDAIVKMEKVLSGIINHDHVSKIESTVSDVIKDAKEYAVGILQINRDIEDLQPDLKGKINNAADNINYQRWILSQAYETQKSQWTTITGLVSQQLNAAVERINEETSGKISVVKSRLILKMDDLRNKIWDVNNTLKGHISQLSSWIEKAQIAVDEALRKVTQIVNEASGNSSTAHKCKLVEAAVKLQDKALTLHGAYEAAKSALPKLANKISNAVKGLDDAIMKDLEGLEKSINMELAAYVKEQIETVLKAIQASDASKGGGLINAGSGVEALKNVSALKEALDSTQEELSKNIEFALDVLKDTAGSKTWKADESNPVLKNLTADLESAVGSAMTAYVKGSDELRNKMVDYQKHITSALTPAIGEITQKALEPITSAISSKSATDSDITKTATELTGTHLKQLCVSIINAASIDSGSVRGKLEKLTEYIAKDKHNMDDTLQKLQNDFNTLQSGKLNSLIEEAQQIIQYASEQSNAIIKRLNAHVAFQINNARDTITNTITTNYVLSLKSLVQEVATKINVELHHLPEMIIADATKKYKGFMKLLHRKINENQLDVAIPDDSNLYHLSFNAQQFFAALLYSVNNDRSILPSPRNILELKSKVHNLVTSLSTFNRHFRSNLSSLSSLLGSIRPASYADDSNPLLECLKKGVQRMCDELDKAYVSVYDSETFGAELVEKNKVTPYGTQLSKVFLSILEIYNEDLRYLKNRTIHKWSTSRIYAGSSLGTFLQNSGYGVSNNETEQNGHLDKNANGTKIMSLLVGENYGHVYHKNKNYKFQLENLYDCLTTYYRIRHISTAGSKKSPCNIYEMLCWLTSLQYSSVYLNFISDEFSDLFDKRENKIAGTNEVDGISFEDQTANKLAAYPQNITYTEVHNAIVHVTSLAPVLLTSIVGYGNEYTTYAVDFYCNTHNFAYPSSSVDCLNTLIEHLRRIVPVFQFLLTRCGFAAKYHGWSDCTYGRDVKSSTWPCNEHSKTEVECQSTSPLQSFLRDCLPGHLPHELTSTGCKSECKTCPKSLPGAPCITPLGFRGFTGSKKTGKELCKVLTKFLGNGVASCLFGLIPKPPSTLSQHFAFTMSLVRNWQSNGTHSLKTNIEAAVTEQSIRLFEQPSDLTAALRNAYGDVRSSHKRESHPEAKNADLCTLSTSTSCTYASSDKLHCGPYLSTLCLEEYRYFADKHCNLYLSWAVYLPWTFYGYLKALLQAFCSISCQDWGCSKCIHGVKCKKGQHGVDNCQCRGLVECRGVQSTFYNYGFTFGNPETLLAKEGKKYCHHFHQQLKSVLESQYFAKLFEECDNFLWIIRQPFIWMNVALWSLSLFYLICVMVGRLDVLHIRSHLRIPSSHSITAQSLLAAAQVGRLAKISYLQP